MSATQRPSVAVVTASYFRGEKCEACGKTAERQRSFTAPTLAECDRQWRAWLKTPLRHKRCETA